MSGIKIISRLKKFSAVTLFLIITGGIYSNACTSAIVSAKASANGKPFIWKHRDTGTEDNFLEKISSPGNLTFIGLFNSDDSLMCDAWLGMNEAGLMIMNTASYNLAPDTASFKDNEGVVMRRALETCRTIDDFTNLLDTFPRPMGVQANFGVIDCNGNGGYFETDDFGYKSYLLSDTVPYIVRTNFSFSGNETDGYGYIRYENARTLLGEEPFTPQMLTEGLSRSFYHSLLGRDMALPEEGKWIIDQDFIPRHSSSASVVMINGLEKRDDDAMFATLGYPPVGELFKVTLDEIPDDVRPVDDRHTAPACNRAKIRKHLAFPLHRGSGPHYIDMDYLRPVNAQLKQNNLFLYQKAGFAK